VLAQTLFSTDEPIYEYLLGPPPSRCPIPFRGPISRHLVHICLWRCPTEGQWLSEFQYESSWKYDMLGYELTSGSSSSTYACLEGCIMVGELVFEQMRSRSYMRKDARLCKDEALELYTMVFLASRRKYQSLYASTPDYLIIC